MGAVVASHCLTFAVVALLAFAVIVAGLVALRLRLWLADDCVDLLGRHADVVGVVKATENIEPVTHQRVVDCIISSFVPQFVVTVTLA